MKKKALKFFFIAGEPSGDLHGEKLINALKKLIPHSLFFGYGGDRMKKAGMNIIEHSDNLAFMGFFEIIKHLPKIYQLLKKTVDIISSIKPDRIILIDYPGFNLRIAKRIVHLNIPITYFILPQAWAWKENRVKTMKKTLDQALSIFPFEKNWFQSKGLTVEYIGHPFVENNKIFESSKSFYGRHNLNFSFPILVLLPGSRQQEIDKHWPVFLKTVKIIKTKFPKLQIIVGKAPNVHLNEIPIDFVIEKESRKAILFSTAAIVASGTATLECAVEKTPMVVCYKLSGFSWYIAKLLVNVKFSSMVNLIGDTKIVPELLQGSMTPENIAKEIIPLLDKKSNRRNKMTEQLKQIIDLLGVPGVYDRAAVEIFKKTKINVN